MKDPDVMVQAIDKLVFQKTTCSLSFIQKVILREALSEVRKTYTQIARENNYSENYIRQGVAPKLWQILSTLLEEKVNRTNCRAVLEQHLDLLLSTTPILYQSAFDPNQLEVPEGQVPLSSKFYIERDGLEERCRHELLKPGAFLRIKAPRKMGKTSLVKRVLNSVCSEGFHTVYISLDQAETAILSSVHRFLRWLCKNVCRQLGLEANLSLYWDEEMGELVSCTTCFQECILRKVQHPVVVAIDDVNQVADYSHLARDFLTLLRSWCERAKDAVIWQKLRITVIQVADIRVPLSTSRSPFNSGLVIELPPFSFEQVGELAQRHGLNLSTVELAQLVELTGGFPYLVRLSLYHSAFHALPLSQVIAEATAENSIFRNHLHQLLWKVKQRGDLLTALSQVLTQPAALDPELCHDLKSLGLIHLSDSHPQMSCRLYQEYFGRQLQPYS